MNTIVDCKIADFCWDSILNDCPTFERSKLNPQIFEVNNIASISVRDKSIHIHPGDEDTLRIIMCKLSDAVSSYYGVNASVTYECDSNIRVSVQPPIRR